ncbi:MAG: DUF2784 domain-containing protein [Gammaproteobacteria bacterium]|nr:DUF2784 domain-containing protein [Gammaproteobacteria bacterium]
MGWSLLADLLVTLHFAFVAFVVTGGLLAWRYPRLIALHLPALAWGVWVEVSSRVCPLTPLENQLRQRGGEAGYSGGFLAHYLHGLLYPAGLVPHVQWVLAVLLIALNAFAYGALWRRSVSKRYRDPRVS